MESFCESMNVSMIPLQKLTGMALVIGRFECDSILAVVPKCVQRFLFDRFL